ncbi:PQQ-binding-like beta-propeller repeat protein [Nostocoides vanveenii]|uniref:Pyrrolo-quinoline quinone repeat domain-containing protein n=1 Tax=Nostocoides vanveenii TaxID=330835 RepID=A0ABN2KWW3_9MICO
MVSQATVPGAAAAVAAPGIGIGPAAMHPGGKVTVTGQGWLPNATVAIRLGTGSVAARVDGTGRFTVRVLVPWAMVPGMVTVRASQGGRAANGRLRVGVDWRMAGFSKARNFVNLYEKQVTKGTVANLKVGGRFAVGGEDPDNAFAWLATLAGRGYACTLTGNIAAFDLASRRVLWEYHEDNPSEIQYCSGDGGPYLDASSGTMWVGLQRFMLETGAYVWGSRGDLTFPYAGKLLVGGTHWVRSLPGAFDPKAGEFAWVAYDAGVFELTLTSAGVLYSVGGPTLYATDPTTGRQLRTRNYAGVKALSTNGKDLIGLFAKDDPNGGVELTRVNPENGDRPWSIDVTTGIWSQVTVDADRAYLVRSVKTLRDRYLVAVDLNGHEKWSTPLPRPGWLDEVRITQANGILCVPIAGALTTYDAATGQQLSSTPITDPAGRKIIPGTAIVDDGHVHVTSTTGIYDLTL